MVRAILGCACGRVHHLDDVVDDWFACQEICVRAATFLTSALVVGSDYRLGSYPSRRHGASLLE